MKIIMTKLFSLPRSVLKSGHFLLGSALLICGCASYQSKIASARGLMEIGKFDEAAEALKGKTEESRADDELAYLLEYATALHQAKKYEESNKVFAGAEKVADLNDYTSLSREAGSILIQEGLVQFKVETFEYLLINVYQAMNYIMLNDYENAQVMARRINDKLRKLEVDEDSRKRQAGFATYLAAILWESQNDWDNAFVLYQKASELMPSVDLLDRDLVRAAKVSRREMDFDRLKKKYPGAAKEAANFDPKKQGEFVFIYQQGWIPRKTPRPENHRFPMVASVPSSVRSVQVSSGDKKITSEKVFDLEIVSRQTIDADFKRLLAKKAAGIVAKAVIANQIDKNKNTQGLGTLAFMALDAMDQADLRQWSLLPASFQLVRMPLNEGKHQIAITGDNGANLWVGEVEIKKGKKHFFTLRTF